MECWLIVFGLSVEIIPLSAQLPGYCSNTSKGEDLVCCINYRKVGEACEECWPGTFAKDCIPCPANHYGRFCKESCNNCTPCDPVEGCNSNKSHHYEDATFELSFQLNYSVTLANKNDSSGSLYNGHFFKQTNIWIIIAICVPVCGVGFTICIVILKKRTSNVIDDQALPISSQGIKISNATNGLIRQNDPGLNLQNQNYPRNEYSHLENFGPYDKLNLKIREDFDA